MPTFHSNVTDNRPGDPVDLLQTTTHDMKYLTLRVIMLQSTQRKTTNICSHGSVSDRKCSGCRFHRQGTLIETLILPAHTGKQRPRSKVAASISGVATIDILNPYSHFTRASSCVAFQIITRGYSHHAPFSIFNPILSHFITFISFLQSLVHGTLPSPSTAIHFLRPALSNLLNFQHRPRPFSPAINPLHNLHHRYKEPPTSLSLSLPVFDLASSSSLHSAIQTPTIPHRPRTHPTPRSRHQCTHTSHLDPNEPYHSNFNSPHTSNTHQLPYSTQQPHYHRRLESRKMGLR